MGTRDLPLLKTPVWQYLCSTCWVLGKTWRLMSRCLAILRSRLRALGRKSGHEKFAFCSLLFFSA